jgi:hypothetical protein
MYESSTASQPELGSRDLVPNLCFCNFKRAPTGRHTARRTPAQLVYGEKRDAPEMTRYCPHILCTVQARLRRTYSSKPVGRRPSSQLSTFGFPVMPYRP